MRIVLDLPELYPELGVSYKIQKVKQNLRRKKKGCSPFWVGDHNIWYSSLKPIFVAVGSQRKGFSYCFLGSNPAPLFSNLPGGRAGLGGVKRL